MRMLETLPGFIKNPDRHNKYCAAVDKRGKYLGAVPAVGAGIRCRIGGEPDGHQGEDQSKEIEEDMGRVREQGQRTGPDPPCYFDRQGYCREKDGYPETSGNTAIKVLVSSHQGILFFSAQSALSGKQRAAFTCTPASFSGTP